VVADQKNSEAYEFIEEISEKGLDLSYQIFMSKYKEILRLLSTTGLSGRQIASQLHVGRDSVAAVR
jgi:hypothetical protein